MDIIKQEQLIRTVSQVGNGAHIFAPKEWINEQVLIIRIAKKTIKEKILEKIYPHLDKITAVILYGSQARQEANENSDIDVLIISKEKFKIEKETNMDIIVLTEKEIQSAIKINPILMYSAIKESTPIINENYIEKLKQIKIDFKDFNSFIEQTEKSIKSDKELTELDKKTSKYSSDSVIYSLFLRLRGVFIINCLLEKQNYSNANFKKWMSKINTSYEKLYKFYRQVREEKYGEDTDIQITKTEELINFLEEELKKLERKIK